MHKVVKSTDDYRIRICIGIRSFIMNIGIILVFLCKVSSVHAYDATVVDTKQISLRSAEYIDAQPLLKKFDIDLARHYFIEKGKRYTKNTELLSLVYENSKRFDINPFLILSLIKRESDFDNTQVSSKDAFGYMQITKYPVEEYEDVFGKVKDPSNPKENIAIGTFYLKKLIAMYDDLHTALIHYQGGVRYFNILKRKNRHKSTPYTRTILTEATTLYFQ